MTATPHAGSRATCAAARATGRSGTPCPAAATRARRAGRAGAGARPRTRAVHLDHTLHGLLHLVLLALAACACAGSLDRPIGGRPPACLGLDARGLPSTLFSTARHENRLDDPDDTRMLDDVVRFRGQRVAAVVVDLAEARGRGAGSWSSTRCCPRCSTRRRPEPGAPLVHGDKDGRRVADRRAGRATSSRDGTPRVGDVAAGFAGLRDRRGDVADPRVRTRSSRRTAPRLDRRRRPRVRAHEHPGAVPGAGGAGRCWACRGAGVHRARRRRVRRQAGDAHRGRRRPGRAADRSAGAGRDEREEQFAAHHDRHPMRVQVARAPTPTAC